MFGFKHTLNGLNHNIQVVARTRLNHRLLVVNGQGNLPTLYPFLRRRLVQTLDALLPLGKPAANGERILTFSCDLVTELLYRLCLSPNCCHLKSNRIKFDESYLFR